MGAIAQYAILRFRPYPETGEFANVGVVLWTPATKRIKYRLAPKAFARVKSFFNELDTVVFRTGVQSFERELVRITNLSERASGSGFKSIIENFTRPRETIFHFSEIRIIRTNESDEELVEKLYERYVGRSFVTKEYRERLMEKNIRRTLKERNLPAFSKQKLETPLFPMEFPLVNRGDMETRIIKPLAFDQDTPQKIFDHGEKWGARLSAIVETSTISRTNILVPIEAPDAPAESRRAETFRFVRKELEKMQMSIVDYKDKKKIFDFAAKAVTRNRLS